MKTDRKIGIRLPTRPLLIMEPTAVFFCQKKNGLSSIQIVMFSPLHDRIISFITRIC